MTVYSRFREHLKKIRDRCSNLSCLKRKKSSPRDITAPIVAESVPIETEIQPARVIQQSRQVYPLVSTAPSVSPSPPLPADPPLSTIVRESPKVAPSTSNLSSPSSDSLNPINKRKSPSRRKPRQSKCLSKCSETSRLNENPQTKCQRKRRVFCSLAEDFVQGFL